MDGPGIHRKQYSFKSNAHQGAATSTGKRKGKASAGTGGGKKAPIKVVFIGNPVRVKTSEAGFRALVQELTGRHADPYKYSSGGSSGGSGAAVDIDADDSSGASPVEPQAGALLLPSPVSTPSSDAASAAGAAQVSVPACDDDDSFAPQPIDNNYSLFSPQLIDNCSYCMFSPPTFLYGGPHGEL